MDNSGLDLGSESRNARTRVPHSRCLILSYFDDDKTLPPHFSANDWISGRFLQIFQEAQDLMPGGVNSPVRAFKSVGGRPIVFDRVKGAYCYDVDGNKYIDYVGSWGASVPPSRMARALG